MGGERLKSVPHGLPRRFKDGRQPFFFPIANSTKLNRLIAGLQECLCSARRAPAASSVEDDLGVLRQFGRSFFDLAHGDMDCTRDGSGVFDFALFTYVDNDKILLRVEFLLQIAYWYSARSHDELTSPCMKFHYDP